MNYINFKDYNGICWMCSKNTADSKEHKYKNSDLKFIKKAINNSTIAKEGYCKQINGIDSNILKYNYVLCKECNNVKSKKIDNDYDLFSNKYIKHLNLSLEKIVFENEKINTYRFLAKNFCCRLSINKIEISKDLIEFINSEKTVPTRLIISIRSNKEKIETIAKHLNSEYADFGQGKLIKYGKSENQIEVIHTTLIYNNLVFEFFYLNCDYDLNNIYNKSEIQISQFIQERNFIQELNRIMNVDDIRCL